MGQSTSQQEKGRVYLLFGLRLAASHLLVRPGGRGEPASDEEARLTNRIDSAAFLTTVRNFSPELANSWVREANSQPEDVYSAQPRKPGRRVSTIEGLQSLVAADVGYEPGSSLIWSCQNSSFGCIGDVAADGCIVPTSTENDALKSLQGKPQTHPSALAKACNPKTKNGWENLAYGAAGSKLAKLSELRRRAERTLDKESAPSPPHTAPAQPVQSSQDTAPSACAAKAPAPSTEPGTAGEQTAHAAPPEQQPSSSPAAKPKPKQTARKHSSMTWARDAFLGTCSEADSLIHGLRAQVAQLEQSNAQLSEDNACIRERCSQQEQALKDMEAQVGTASQQFKADWDTAQADLQKAQRQLNIQEQKTARERRDHERELAVLRDLLTEAGAKSFSHKTAAAKQEAQVRAAEEADPNVHEDHWQGRSEGGCRVVIESDPPPGQASGRLSFNPEGESAPAEQQGAGEHGV
ncbi:hypothetical protein WJX73_000457 [Symbiochloris irregularis]|uniref:Uncharacterized protein n=1 Tax=Symbiochloris irregularis TaxID=706552 RepID=A0AAW1P5U0_9CHLO